jgi:cytochrome c oxidase subunit 3
MSAILLFLAVIGAIAGWWLSQQRLTSKPWLEQGVSGGMSGGAMTLPAAKIGLGVLLAVVGALFALFFSAYFMRMELSDWQPLPIPRLLWLNTGMLVLSSIALQCSVVAARRGQIDMVRLGLVTGGITTFGFLAGQILAWRELSATGYLMTSNPANSFFYLITGLHALHILGGLAALGRTTARAWSGSLPTAKLRLSTELCATYWHFLLLVWLFVFALLAGWADDFIEICRQLLS